MAPGAAGQSLSHHPQGHSPYDPQTFPLLLHPHRLLRLRFFVCLCMWFIFNSLSGKSSHPFLNPLCPPRLNLHLPLHSSRAGRLRDIMRPFTYNHYNYLCFTCEKTKTQEKQLTQSHTVGRCQEGTDGRKEWPSVHF